MLNNIDININYDEYEIKKIDIELSTPVAYGSTSYLYKISDNKILKLFNPGTSEKFAITEFMLSNYCYESNIKTSKPYEIIKLNDNYGIVYQFLNGLTIAQYLAKYPERFNDAIEKYYESIVSLNSTKCTNNAIISAKTNIIHKLDRIKNHFEDKNFAQLNDIVNSIEESNNLLHGDPNIKNIMYHDDELYIIDIGTIVKGNYLFDFASLLATYKNINLITNNSDEFYMLKPGTCNKIINKLLQLYNLSESELFITEIISMINIIHLYTDFYEIIKKSTPLSQEKAIDKGVDHLLSILQKYNK